MKEGAKETRKQRKRKPKKQRKNRGKEEKTTECISVYDHQGVAMRSSVTATCVAQYHRSYKWTYRGNNTRFKTSVCSQTEGCVFVQWCYDKGCTSRPVTFDPARRTRGETLLQNPWEAYPCFENGEFRIGPGSPECWVTKKLTGNGSAVRFTKNNAWFISLSN